MPEACVECAGIAASGTVIMSGTETICEVVSFDGPNLSSEQIDVSSMGTLGWRCYVQGISDAGELSMTLNFLPTAESHEDLVCGLGDGTNDYSIVFPDAASTTWTFEAFVSQFGVSGSFDGKLEATATLKLTGKPDFVTALCP